MNIWVTSDTHFDHKNIIKYCNRPFRTVDEMNNAIWQNWNSVVDVDDIVYHLGDFALGPSDGYIRRVNNLLGVLNGKIYLVKGNHDRKVNQLNFEAVFNGIELDGLLLSHVPKETDLINV
ncbi:MAG: metallophosphoesterase, partial [Cellulosilyticum sp.]|nr:metallophosphoesterase [Cellulosilyticum sp.]